MRGEQQLRRVGLFLAVGWAIGIAAPLRAAYPAPARGENGMVVTAHPEATRAALKILREGGNAIDAAICAAFVLGVVEPYSSGLGGGGFLLHHRIDLQQTVALDFREQAPLAATRTIFLREGKAVSALSREGALSVATPGQVAGLLTALERFGTLPRARILAPAIRLARKGFRVTPRYRRIARKSLGKLRRDPEARRLFLIPKATAPGPSGAATEADAFGVPPLGHTIVQRDLARTLQRIARLGPAGFYRGPVAKALVKSVRAGGGILSREDLAAYRPTFREPVIGTYRGFEIHAMPPPSSGGVILIELLNILEGYDLRADGWRAPTTLHLMIEAMRRAFADRNTQMGDPAFVKNPVALLTDKGYAAKLRATIDPTRASASKAIEPLAPLGEGARSLREAPAMDGGQDTSHLSVVDAAGNAVALTSTVNYLFGSGLVAKGTGVLLNDEMDDFAAAPGAPNVFGLVQGEANAVAPRKIPLSSMSPTLVFDRKEGERRLRFVLGSPGGPRIITTVMLLMIELIDHHSDIQTATSLPRLHQQWWPDRVFVEPGFEAATLRGLRVLGHTLVEEEPWSAANCIAIDPETQERLGASDPRQEGLAEGF